MFAGMMARPRAISLRTSSGSSFSRPATKAISSVITPWRAKCICETLRPSPLLRTSDPFAAAVSFNRFSIQPSRTPILPPEEIPRAGHLSRDANYRTARPERQQGYDGWLQVRDVATTGIHDHPAERIVEAALIR